MAALAVGSKIVCVSDFEPRLADEMRARKLDQFVVREIFSDGWLLVMNEQTLGEGVLPASYCVARPSSLVSLHSEREAPGFKRLSGGTTSVDDVSPPTSVRGSLSMAAPGSPEAHGSGSRRSSANVSGTLHLSMSGWLEIELPDGKWKRSWYIVEGNSLKVCKNPSSLASRKEEMRFDLSSTVRLLKHVSNASAPPVLELIVGRRTLYLRTTSAKDADLWVEAVQRAISTSAGGGSLGGPIGDSWA